MLASSFNWTNAWEAALAVFLLATGLALAYLFVRLSRTADSVTSLIKGTETEVLPVINKVGGSVDRINVQLDKVDKVTDSAVDAADAADTAVRAVSLAITKPVQKITGLAAGVSYGASDFRAKKSWKHAVNAGKEAAARREQELDEELHEAGKGTN
ncbi:MAG TPA: DUF948 domain-containing protein [Gaiellaceae bacterium]|nr:DUF948 domain-containing protein [Gaiellaceae bacterium]